MDQAKQEQQGEQQEQQEQEEQEEDYGYRLFPERKAPPAAPRGFLRTSLLTFNHRCMFMLHHAMETSQ